MKEAVLLLAHGAPEQPEDIAEYFSCVRGGQPVPESAVAELRSRYQQIGGASPLLARTREQAAALQQELGVPVYFGMRNWRPFIADTLGRMRADGIGRIVAICLAPQYSKMSVGFYFRRTQEAKNRLGFDAEIVWAKSFHDHPLLIKAFRERLEPLLPAEMVLFTAHSLPEKILENRDPYDAESRATARLVAESVRLPRWEFAYQSQGRASRRWLGPTVESVLDGFRRRGIRSVVLVPVGFVCDHVEILYDVDIHFRRYAAERGIELRRTESLNASPTFARALADVARRRLETL